MKLYSNILGIAYLFSVMFLSLLEYSQYLEVGRLRGQIEQHQQLMGARDEGLRMEIEYRRLRSKISSMSLASGDGPESLRLFESQQKSTLLWFDIFWSRVVNTNFDSMQVNTETAEMISGFFDDVKQDLRIIEPMIRNAKLGDRKLFHDIDMRLNKYDAGMTKIATLIVQKRIERASELQRQLDNALVSMNGMLLASAAGVVLIITLFGTETYRARKEERRIKEREARVRYLAEHDSLTGLRNRAYLNSKIAEWIKEADKTGYGFNLILMDLDKFKDVNDTYGHPMGDRLLKKAAARLTGIFPSSYEIVVRLGGDEFAILKRGTFDNTKHSAQKSIDAMSRLFEMGGNDIQISTSVGISRYPDLSKSAEELLRHADLALYEAKKQGRRTFTVYEHEMSVAMTKRVQLEADLRNALQNGGLGLEVYYQPQVNFASELDGDTHAEREITGVEALVRWFHPERGAIPPMEFIELAEETGLIAPLSEWIFQQACKDTVAWHNAGFKINLSVNISPFQLNNPSLPQELLAHIHTTGLDPNYLTLEITESADVNDTEAAAELMSVLVEKGISLAMDDFGTGYSNLGYLKNLPLHTLKIDRTFVTQLEEAEDSRKLVRGIVNLAKGMGLNIVAEGVETEWQADFLRNLNCEIGQGYLFGRPMHKLGIVSLLSKQGQKAQRAKELDHRDLAKQA